jgi:hypothetical protein
VGNSGVALEFAPKLQSRKSIALIAVTQDGAALRCVALNLRNDRDIVLAAVNHAPHRHTQQKKSYITYASVEMKDDVEVMTAAVARNGLTLKFGGNKARGDRGVVLAAVSNNGEALQYASDELKGCKEVRVCSV